MYRLCLHKTLIPTALRPNSTSLYGTKCITLHFEKFQSFFFKVTQSEHHFRCASSLLNYISWEHYCIWHFMKYVTIWEIPWFNHLMQPRLDTTWSVLAILIECVLPFSNFRWFYFTKVGLNHQVHSLGLTVTSSTTIFCFLYEIMVEEISVIYSFYILCFDFGSSCI